MQGFIISHSDICGIDPVLFLRQTSVSKVAILRNFNRAAKSPVAQQGMEVGLLDPDWETPEVWEMEPEEDRISLGYIAMELTLQSIHFL